MIGPKDKILNIAKSIMNNNKNKIKERLKKLKNKILLTILLCIR